MASPGAPPRRRQPVPKRGRGEVNPSGVPHLPAKSIRKVRVSVRKKLFAVFALVMLGYSVVSNGYLMRYFFDDKARYVLFSIHQGAESLCVKLGPHFVPNSATDEIQTHLRRELSTVDYAESYVFDVTSGHPLFASTDEGEAGRVWSLVGPRVQGGKMSNFTFQHQRETGTRDLLFISVCRIGTLAATAGSNAILVLSVNASTALNPARALLLKLGAMFLGLLLLGFGIFWLLANSLTKPLKRLTELADNLGAGNFRFQVQVPNQDELGALSDSFNILADRLEQRESELERTTEMANKDFLTGLWNRRHAEGRLQEQLLLCKRYGRELSVIYMDADHFKRINDVHGHAAGDEVLKGFAEILKSQVRSTDFAARMGGEEFCVVLPETNLEGAIKAAVKLREAIKAFAFLPQLGTVKMTASLGVESLSRKPCESVDELVAAADAFAYQSKTGGRDRISSAEGQIS